MVPFSGNWGPLGIWMGNDHQTANNNIIRNMISGVGTANIKGGAFEVILFSIMSRYRTPASKGRHGKWLTLAAMAALQLTTMIRTEAQTNAFTYQGRLSDQGSAASGTYDLILKLFDDVSGGNQIGPTITYAGQ